MKYLLKNNNFEVNGKQYLKDVGGYDGTNVGDSKDVATVISEIVSIIPEMISVTYDELLSLRNNSELIPGKQYKIIDYVTTTMQENTMSAGHQFDIIVTALDEGILSEEAKAIQNDNDDYFDSCNLSAWKIWYSLDNDSSKFEWIDTENGKGVIYRMIDEWGNDCPYDFKNIMFKRWLWDERYIADEEEFDFYTYCYTFSFEKEPENIIDTSIFGNDGALLDDEGQISGVYGNIINKRMYNASQMLNDIVFFSTFYYDSDSYYGCCNNTFGNNCYSNTFCDCCYNNTFGDSCYNNTFGSDCYNNTFGNYCIDNTFGALCYLNTFDSNCYSNIFSDNCYSNIFGNSCCSNNFYYGCYYNTFGIGCSGNAFGDNCNNNTFGNNCNNNSFIYFSNDEFIHFVNNINYGNCVSDVILSLREDVYNFYLKNISVSKGFESNGEYIILDEYIDDIASIIDSGAELTVCYNSNGDVSILCLADY